MTALSPSEFIAAFDLEQLTAGARRRLDLAILDLVAVCQAGRGAPAATIAAETAASLFGAGPCTSWVSGEALSPAAAAWSNGVLANVLDLDDGHSLTKGHPGAVVIPAALAIAEHAGAGPSETLAAIAVGYEVAVRAGIEQHRRSPDYHGTGSWGALGAASAAARLLRLDPEQTRQALGLAEYHGPLALIMRSVAAPAMTKDGIGWGALVGVSSALLSQAGFTATESVFETSVTIDVSQRSALEELYLKPFPCCRWAQSAVVAAEALTRSPGFIAADVDAVEIRTFAASAALATGIPADTEQAQYSLVWPVACQLALGRYGVAEALGGFDDPHVGNMVGRIEIAVDPELTAAFPAQRLSEVVVHTTDGRRLTSGITEPRGEAGDPAWEDLALNKAHRLLAPAPSWPRAFVTTGLNRALASVLETPRSASA